ncbi:acyl--CoA ligase [Aspergillus tanneri]|uniref:Nonribosomal peptide synthetases (NRPS) n=1 Tax=Aspergillus tanneri TaxID=1220188 RepID=A0A5M9MRR7_9EURO|nr:Nonribosomal peptide synthetases (NRPS) [Aspergillus tanneri]KAA8648000.1 Nonribosomal peptide synthetases (NRPS) [Aspergillus tanneri]
MDSPRTDVHIPDVDIWTLLFERDDLQTTCGRASLTDAATGQCYTYEVIRERALAFGQLLQQKWNWQKGDVLVTHTGNSIDLPPIIWGTLAIGGVVCPTNPQYNVSELSFVLGDTRARAVVTDNGREDVAREAVKRAGAASDAVISLAYIRDELSSSQFKNVFRPAITCPESSLAFLVYSSGTTGRPKGVMLSHRNMVANVMQSSLVARDLLGAEGRILAMLPFFHIYGITCLLSLPLYLGIPIFVMPRFQLKEFCTAVEKHRITCAFVVPPVIRQLVLNIDEVRQNNLQSLRVMVSGAAPLDVGLIHTLQNELNVPISQGFGMSECAPCTHWQECQHYPGSVGRLLPNMTARLVAVDRGNDSQTGELWVKGPNVFLGYLNNGPTNNEVFSEDGYYKTGDVGYQDVDGNFYITDRIKEMIKYNGFQIAPGELESLLCRHPAVADAAVAGIEHDGTELPRAYVVLRYGCDLTPDQNTANALMEFVNGLVISYKRLRGGVSFVAEIPRSPAGKTLRRVLKELYSPVFHDTCHKRIST